MKNFIKGLQEDGWSARDAFLCGTTLWTTMRNISRVFKIPFPVANKLCFEAMEAAMAQTDDLTKFQKVYQKHRKTRLREITAKRAC